MSVPYAPSGQTVPFASCCRARVDRDHEGKVLRLFGTVQDITEQRQLEETLSQEAIRRRILVEQSSDGIVVLDQDGRVFEANQRFGEMLGYTADEVGRLHVWDWDVQWTRQELLSCLACADESGTHFETRHRRKDGTLLDVEISGNGALCTGRKLVFCVCRDISRRKQAEKDIRNLNASLERRVAERTAELESMLANATVGLAFFNRELQCFRINSKLAEMSGLPVSDNLERKLVEINPWPARADESAIREVFRSRRPLVGGDLDFVSAARPTEKRSCVVSYYPVFDPSGAVISVGMTVTDITERKEFENALAALNRSLTDEVAMRSGSNSTCAGSPTSSKPLPTSWEWPILRAKCSTSIARTARAWDDRRSESRSCSRIATPPAHSGLSSRKACPPPRAPVCGGARPIS